ncbi:hypothetical protein T310_1304, partial [Rasamsonia emersonii CBS 393.64]
YACNYHLYNMNQIAESAKEKKPGVSSCSTMYMYCTFSTYQAVGTTKIQFNARFDRDSQAFIPRNWQPQGSATVAILLLCTASSLASSVRGE